MLKKFDRWVTIGILLLGIALLGLAIALITIMLIGVKQALKEEEKNKE